MGLNPVIFTDSSMCDLMFLIYNYAASFLYSDDNTDVALSTKLQTAEVKQGILDVDTNASDQKLVLATPNVQGPDHDAQTEDSMLSNGSTLVAATMADSLECDGLTQSEVQQALNQQQVITVIQKGEKQYLISNHEEHMVRKNTITQASVL